MIDHFEARLALRIVDAADVDQHLEQAVRLVTQEDQDPGDRGGLHAQGQLPARHAAFEQDVTQGQRDLLEEFAQRLFTLG